MPTPYHCISSFSNLVSWNSWLHCPAPLAEAGLGARLELRPVHCHHQGGLVQKYMIKGKANAAMVVTRRTSRSSLSLILQLSSTSEKLSTHEILNWAHMKYQVEQTWNTVQNTCTHLRFIITGNIWRKIFCGSEYLYTFLAILWQSNFNNPVQQQSHCRISHKCDFPQVIYFASRCAFAIDSLSLHEKMYQF